MKKLFLMAVAILFIGSSFATSTSSYTTDDSQIEQLFAASDDVSMSSADEAASLLTNINSVGAADETTKSGFLVRAFFCGWFGLHRSYMGTKGKFVAYFCTLGFVSCIDFWGVVIKGDEGFAKFKGNDKFWVWGKK